MKAIWFEQTGAAGDVLIYGEREQPTAGDGEVLVRLYASAHVNDETQQHQPGHQT